MKMKRRGKILAKFLSSAGICMLGLTLTTGGFSVLAEEREERKEVRTETKDAKADGEPAEENRAQESERGEKNETVDGEKKEEEKKEKKTKRKKRKKKKDTKRKRKGKKNRKKKGKNGKRRRKTGKKNRKKNERKGDHMNGDTDIKEGETLPETDEYKPEEGKEKKRSEQEKAEKEKAEKEKAEAERRFREEEEILLSKRASKDYTVFSNNTDAFGRLIFQGGKDITLPEAAVIGRIGTGENTGKEVAVKWIATADLRSVKAGKKGEYKLYFLTDREFGIGDETIGEIRVVISVIVK